MEDTFDLNNLLIGNSEEELESTEVIDAQDALNLLNTPLEEEEEENSEEKTEETEEAAEEEETQPENVGNSKQNIKEQESTESQENGTSPNIYSSIAKVLKEEGTFPDLDDESLESIKDSETFIEAIQTQIRNSMDEEYRRIEAALNVGVPSNTINSYKNTIKYLSNINEEDIRNEENEELRKNLIIQDMLNRGYSRDRAERTYQKGVDRGDDDVEDALEALEANKEYFKDKYDALLKDAELKQEEVIKKQKERAQNFKKIIMEDKQLYGDFEVDKKTREKIYDALTKPAYTNKETGRTLTAVQKWQEENPEVFAKSVGLIYMLTNGGKDFSKILDKKIKKEVSKTRQDFEAAIRNTPHEGGKLRLANTSRGNDSLDGYSLII